MSAALLDRLLSGRLANPDGAGMLQVPVRSVVIARGLAAAACDLIAPLGLGGRLAAVMDPDTRAVMGEAVADALRRDYRVEVICFGDSPHPDMEAVSFVREHARGADGIVAVGSGSLNDIAKHAAYLNDIPYAVFGTAPSMNGYASSSAAITEDGLKKSLASAAPRGIFLDLEVMAAAPARLIAAGVGDSLCRATAQTDWLMSHLLLGTKYRQAPFMLTADDEEELLGRIGSIAARDVKAVELLARMLVMSGFGMTICGGSYPASQGEHLIAHYIDMLGRNLPRAFHGEHVAVATMTMAALQDRILERESLTLSPSAETERDFIAHFGEDLGRSCWRAWLPKRIDAAAADALNRKLAADWPLMRARLRTVGRSQAALGQAYAAAGAPLVNGQIGVPDDFYREAVANARRIRDRFTFLDLAAAAGQ
ncbi:MAG TPA: iron-containing alcohol dehydrogenase [Pseudorhodoplanes sp.]|jgi:glycerol-1-phosphate dehydrogenase [NAD(P)+]|nr:iron-containing alcohol dehydrogenase [Pseudorhodoplanes sp.]